MQKRFVAIEESQKKGTRIQELVRGSLNFAIYEIDQAFQLAFPSERKDGYEKTWRVAEAFDDYVVVYGSIWNKDTYEREPVAENDFYRVSFSRAGEQIVFAAREDWTVLETSYQPKGMQESVWLMEAKAENGVRQIRINRLMTAGEVNGNNRRYSAAVLKQAVNELKTHLHESAGQGRLMLLGEVEHPSDKGARRANLMETVIRWTEVEFDGKHVNVSGLLAAETEGGRHIQALALIGVAPGGSIRGYGLTETVRDGKTSIEEVTEIHITGIDLVGEPSFKNSQTLLESIDTVDEEKLMNKAEQLKLIMRARPDLVRGLTEAQIDAMTDSQMDELFARLSEAMQIDLSKVDIGEALEDMASKAAQFEQAQRANAITAAIAEATKDLPYGEKGNAAFVEAVQASKPQDAKAVASIVESKRKEYDVLFAGQKLSGMGFSGRVTGVAPVLEAETGTPEFARGAFEVAESIRKHDFKDARNWNSDKLSVNDKFVREYLKKFDAQYKSHLMAESRLLAEAEITTDLNLPYSVSRAIIEEAFPTLVASGIFDVGLTDQSPSRIYYETFAGETGYTGSVTDEAVTADLNEWVQLANKRLTPATMVLTNSGGGTTYAEGTDYVVDYANGRLKALATITDGQSLLADYSYTAIRKGELVGIERGKLTLAYKTLEIAADRLATEISREAIVFSRSQLGMDAIASTLSSLARQVSRKIDQGLIYMGLSAALSVANNSGGTWTAASDTYDDLVKKIGVARVKVANRYYQPNFVLCSETNADRLANWDGFTAAGARADADLNANGYAGRVKGLAVFASTQMPDTYFLTGNRQLVMHRIFQSMVFRGPFPTYNSDRELVASEQYYAEEFNGTDAPVAEKGATVKVA